MAKPSLEGLRLALLDGGGFSIRRSDEPESFEPFASPRHCVEAIEVADARYMGRGRTTRLTFSPWLNALVGGRGTGKSTVIHALRLAVRREQELTRVELPRFRGHLSCWEEEVSAMPKSRPPYPAEFRRQMVELVRSGRTPEALAREFEPSAQAIRNWVAQAGRDAGERTDGLRTGEREEMRRLRRENRRLREEREILAKATAWFARETGSGGSTGS